MTLLPTKSNRSSAPAGGLQAPFMLGDADLCGVDFGYGRRRTSHRSQRPRRKILGLLQMFPLRRGVSSQSRESRGNDDHLCSSHRTIASLPEDGTRKVNWSARRPGSARWSRTKKGAPASRRVRVKGPLTFSIAIERATLGTSRLRSPPTPE